MDISRSQREPVEHLSCFNDLARCSYDHHDGHYWSDTGVRNGVQENVISAVVAGASAGYLPGYPRFALDRRCFVTSVSGVGKLGNV